MSARDPCISFVESDSISPATVDEEEIWWTDHYECDCGWESPRDQALSDGGRALAEQHSAETGHQFC